MGRRCFCEEKYLTLYRQLISIMRHVKCQCKVLLRGLWRHFYCSFLKVSVWGNKCSLSPTYRVKHVPKKYPQKIIENMCIKFGKLFFPGEHSDISHRELVTLQNIAHVIQSQKTTWPGNRKSEFKLFMSPSESAILVMISLCKNEPGGVTIYGSWPANGLRPLYHTERADSIHFSSEMKLLLSRTAQRALIGWEAHGPRLRTAFFRSPKQKI